MLIYLFKIVFIVFMFSLIGYISIVISEKMRLKQGTIILKNIPFTKDAIQRIDTIEMELMEKKLRTGDEIKLKLICGKTIKGIIVGFSKEKGKTLYMNTKDKLSEIKIKDISKIKVLSRYGKFFSF